MKVLVVIYWFQVLLNTDVQKVSEICFCYYLLVILYYTGLSLSQVLP
jgi:hypothetical protein